MNCLKPVATVLIGLTSLLWAVPAIGQNQLPSAAISTIIVATPSPISNLAQTFNVGVVAPSTFTAMSDATWLTTEVGTTGVTLTAAYNSGEVRSATVTVTCGTRTKTFTVSQKENPAIEAEGIITITSASATDNESGHPISYTYDGSTSTIWHSDYTGTTHTVSSSNPETLIYNFSATHVNQFVYTPRQDGGTNGNFKEISVYYKTSSSSSYVLLGSYNLNGSGSSYTVTVNKDDVTSIKIVVNSGIGNFASCAEMQFYKTPPVTSASIFTDITLSALNTGTTQADVDAVTDPYLNALAQSLLDKTYDATSRVSTQTCLLSPSALSSQWSTPGKYYDQNQGVTGILIPTGKNVVMVSGIPSGKTIKLKVIGWTVPEGKTYNSEEFTLTNGMNIINRSSTWSGLAYVNYYDDTPATYASSPIKVHFVNGMLNGVLTPSMSNTEIDNVLSKACYTTIDLFGAKVHSVWEVSALQKYAKGRYRQYMNILDTLVGWEHRLLGLEKYKLVPTNKTFAYVNYDYYMYQGGAGVSYKYDTQDRCCNPTKLLYSDDDVIWGLSHEWGHQHQMQPYFCWSGMSESSNNMNSCYNVLHMGYDGSRVSDGWNTARSVLLEDYTSSAKTANNAGTISRKRYYAYKQASTHFSWCTDVNDVALAMADSSFYAKDGTKTTVQSASTLDVYTTSEANYADRGISASEVYVESNLAPFFMLHCYFSNKENHADGNDYYPDYTPDLYQSLRSTNSGTDKYELLAAAQNGVSGKYAAFSAAYPSSYWITRGYVTSSSTTWQNSIPYIFNYVRKASKICGYNLYPFFEKWGFFRIIALVIDDYGNKYTVMTKKMRDEFKTDMDALVTTGYSDASGNTVKLKEMPTDMINSISNAAIPHYSRPVIPN